MSHSVLGWAHPQGGNIIEKLNFEIQGLRERLQRWQEIDGQARRAQAALGERRGLLSPLRKKLKQERADVEKLEGLSLTSLFHTFLSSKKEQLQKERQELLQAKLKYDECLAATQKLEQSVIELRAKLEDKYSLDAEYKSIIQKKEALLLQEDSEGARRLLVLAEHIADARTKLQALRKASTTGDHASESLDLLIESLSKARGWGNWDMLGGDLISTAIKHSHIDKARDFAHEAQDDLFDFENELEGVKVYQELSIEISGFNRFADYLLDGLIFDWVVQSKIKRSLDEAEKTQLRLDKILKYLNGEIATAAARTEELEDERRQAIEGA